MIGRDAFQVTCVVLIPIFTTHVIANGIDSHYYLFAFALNTFQEVENGQGLSCGDGEAWLVFDANASLFPAALLQMQTAQRQAITPIEHGPQGAVSVFRGAFALAGFNWRAAVSGASSCGPDRPVGQ
jgi:hypothetical protein